MSTPGRHQPVQNPLELRPRDAMFGRAVPPGEDLVSHQHVQLREQGEELPPICDVRVPTHIENLGVPDAGPSPQ